MIVNGIEVRESYFFVYLRPCHARDGLKPEDEKKTWWPYEVKLSMLLVSVSTWLVRRPAKSRKSFPMFGRQNPICSRTSNWLSGFLSFVESQFLKARFWESQLQLGASVHRANGAIFRLDWKQLRSLWQCVDQNSCSVGEVNSCVILCLSSFRMDCPEKFEIRSKPLFGAKS